MRKRTLWERSPRGALRVAIRGLSLISVAAMATPAAQAQSNMLLGMFPGSADMASTSAWLNKRPAVELLFTSFDPRATDWAVGRLGEIWNGGSVPIFTWELFTDEVARTAPANIDALVANGSYDAYLRDYAARLKVYLSGPDSVYGNADDRRMYLRLAHEMNGNWYPWSADYPGANQTGADYIGMWRRVHDIFVGEYALDRKHVQWMWIPNNCDCTPTNLELYYPGHDYVDWVGVDGYNFGSTQSSGVWTHPADVLAPWLTRVAAVAPGKPLAVPETGSTTSGGDKLQWMRDLWGATSYYQGPAGERVRLLNYFNVDKETDWAVYGGSGGDETHTYNGVTRNGYSSFRQLMGGSANVIGATAGAPRLLTDAQFAGKLDTKPLKNGRYQVVAVHSGKCLQVAGGSKKNGAKIQQWSCDAVEQQQFDLKHLGEGFYKLANVLSGKAVEVADSSVTDGADVQQWAYSGGEHQRFKIVATSVAGQFTLVNLHSGKCVDVAEGGTKNGDRIQQWGCSGLTNQTFRFKKQ